MLPPQGNGDGARPLARGNAIRLRKCRAPSRACRGMMAAQLRQRLLRPAALAGRRGGDRRALDFLLAKLARRQAKPMPEHPAEMRGIVKTVAVGDFRDRMMRLGRAGQFCRGPLQPALAQIMREARAGTLKQLLQIALDMPSASATRAGVRSGSSSLRSMVWQRRCKIAACVAVPPASVDVAICRMNVGKRSARP